MFAKSIVAVAVFASFVAAQGANSTIDPNTIDATMRSQWCLGQRNTCGTLCSGELQNNDCDVTTLVYNCTCAANGSAPGLEYYQNSMPTFICEKIFDNCISANEGVASAQANCRAAEAKNCGHLDPAKFTAAAGSSSASQSATSTPTGTSDPASTETPVPTSSSSAAAAPMMSAQYGTGAIALGVAAAFGYML